jgi:hypothetical protein
LSDAPFHTNPSDGALEAPAALDRARVVAPRVGFTTVTGIARRRCSRTQTVGASPPTTARGTTTTEEETPPTGVRNPPRFDTTPTVFPFPRIVVFAAVGAFAVTGVARIIITIRRRRRRACTPPSRRYSSSLARDASDDDAAPMRATHPQRPRDPGPSRLSETRLGLRRLGHMEHSPKTHIIVVSKPRWNNY